MITFAEADIGDVIDDVTMMLNAAVPEYQRLRAEFSSVTDEAIEAMMQRIVYGPAIEPGEIVDPLASNFARFKLAHAAAVNHRDALRKGKPTAQDVRRAYLGTADALASIGSILRQIKGLTYAASYVSEFTSQLVKHHKTSKQGRQNTSGAAERERTKADREALEAVEQWQNDPLRQGSLRGLSRAAVVERYLKGARPPRRQATRLRDMLKNDRIEK